MKPYLLCAALVLSGCATNSGVLPLSDGMHKVSRQGNGAWVTTESLKADAIKEADAYCGQSGKRVKVIDVKQIQAKPFGGWPEAEALFRCE